MKKINFKVILVIVLALILTFSFAACNKPEPTTSKSPSPSPSTGPNIALYLNEVITGLDSTINSLSDLTDRFEAEVEFYATVNDVDYLVSITANIDLTADADNDDSKLAIVVSKDEAVLFGFYYSGVEEALFLDFPSKGIKRYIDGFNFVDAVHMFYTPTTGGFASAMPNVSLGAMVGDMLDLVATMAFSDVDVSVEGTVTTYDFTFNADLLGMLPMLFGMLGDALTDVELMIDDIFGVSGFKFNGFTVPSFDMSLIAKLDAGKLVNLGIELDVPAFDFYINADRYELIGDSEYTGNKYSIKSYAVSENGLFKKVGSDYVLITEADSATETRYAPSEFEVNTQGTYKPIDPIEVNALDLKAGINLKLNAAGDDFDLVVDVPTKATTGYTYFSPLNISTSGVFTLSDEGTAKFLIKTDINPFLLINDDKITDAKAYILIETWATGQTEDDAVTLFELNIIGGDVYILLLDEGVNKYYTLDIKDGYQLVKDVIDALMDGELIFPEPSDEEEEEGEAIDIMAVVDLVTKVPDLIVDGVLTVDKAFVQEVVTALALDETLPEDLELTAWLLYDAVDTDKIIGARAEFYLKTIKGEGAEAVTTETTYYAEFLVDGDTYSVEYGTIVDEVDTMELSATLTLNFDEEDVFVGFVFDLVNNGVIPKVPATVNLTLTDFTFVWGEAVNVTEAAVPANATEYVNVLDGVTKDTVIADLQKLVDKLFGVEPTTEITPT